MEECPHCKQQVSKNALLMHTLRCSRIIRCDACDAVFQTQEQLQNHKETSHQFTCVFCSAIFTEEAKLKNHESNECKNRMVTCRFCGMMEPFGESLPKDYNDRLKGFSVHESYCGGRTTECDKCGNIIKLKDLKAHDEVFHGKYASIAHGKPIPIQMQPSPQTQTQPPKVYDVLSDSDDSTEDSDSEIEVIQEIKREYGIHDSRNGRIGRTNRGINRRKNDREIVATAIF
eukprot:TRINITY_DN781816_c0_g1_i1.p1 TRINITY_DN781816_c0_g1~~TRINITY_DN781816_c0_g1_i1.p1  ORF type:complete len:230 (-),score=33.14 TRINITY_DN781816_c0_g1_i1:79-768(-)